MKLMFAGTFTRLSKLWPIAAFLIIASYFIYLASDGWYAYFNADDVTNIYFGRRATYSSLIRDSLFFWHNAVRPVGMLIFRIAYDLFELTCPYYRALCFGWFFVNLALQFRLYQVLSRDLLFSVLALVIGCFHGTLFDLYASVGTIFDIASLTFILIALLWYASIRESNRFPSWPVIGGLILLQILAYGAKEMGMMLGAVIVAYELILAPREGQWSERLRGPAALVVAEAAIALARVLFPGPLSGHAGYTPELSWARLSSNSLIYTQMLFFPLKDVSIAAAVAFWGVLGLLVAISRSRMAWFGLVYYWVTIVPLLVAPARTSGYVLYVPLFGLSLCVAALIDWLAKFGGSRVLVRTTVYVAALAVTVWLQKQQSDVIKKFHLSPGGQDEAREIVTQFPELTPHIPDRTRVLIFNSPYPEEDGLLSMYVLSLLYRAKEIPVQVRRLADHAEPVSAPPGFGHIYYYHRGFYTEYRRNPDGTLMEVLKPGHPSMVDLKAAGSEKYVVRDIGGADAGQSKWANQNPEVKVAAPAAHCQARIEYHLPTQVLEKTGPMRMSVWANGRKESDFVLKESGDHQLVVPLAETFTDRQPVSLHLHFENPFIAEADQAKLTVLLIRMGLEASPT